MHTDFLSYMSDDAVAAVVSGRTDPAVVLLSDTMRALRGAEADTGESVAGVLLETETPAEMSDGAFDRLMAAIDEDEFGADPTWKKAAASAGSAINELIALPEPLREAALDAAGDSGWRFAGPGIRILPLNVDGRAEAEIIRIEPGSSTPRHTHDGVEFTLCLSGGFTDERGSYGPGDLSVADPGVTHRPTADDGEVCFVLAVRDAGLRFTGVLGALQRVFGR
ncbi:MAG: cupin domain-containing protein [Pseudomonadota bacterium]